MAFDPQFHSSHRFSVAVEGIPYAAFSECTLPSLEVETQPVKEGGQNLYTHKLPVRINNGTITLKHGVMVGSKLLEWYMQVLNGDWENAIRQVTVSMFDSDHVTPLMVWNFRRAYPTKWSGPALKSDDRAVGIESLEIAFHGFEVE